MSILSIGGAGGGSYPSVTGPSSSASTNAAGQALPTAGRTDDMVTLSPEAQALASLNAQGVTVAQVPLSDPNPDGLPHFVPLETTLGAVSQGDFETLATRFGLSSGAADQLFRQIDTDGDGAVSNAEFIKAMGATREGASPLSSGILRMMDTDRSGSVSGSEFLNLESAVVQAEKPTEEG